MSVSEPFTVRTILWLCVRTKGRGTAELREVRLCEGTAEGALRLCVRMKGQEIAEGELRLCIRTKGRERDKRFGEHVSELAG